MACMLVAIKYEEGEVIARDLAQAKEYYGKYCDAGYEEGCKEYKRLNQNSSINATTNATINQNDLQKAVKAVVNNMKLIITDLGGFRSAGYYDGVVMSWSGLTSAEIITKDGASASETRLEDVVFLGVNGKNECIKIKFNPNFDDFIGLVSFSPNPNASGLCAQVIKDSNVKMYLKGFEISAYGE